MPMSHRPISHGPISHGPNSNRPISRRLLLAGAGAAAMAGPAPLLAQGAHTTFTVRMDRELASLDPAFRTGPQEGSIIWAVFQKLIRFKPGSTEWELDAAQEIRQASPTVVEFTLKPGQMFTDGHGEMTADDVKFSFERIAGVEPAGGKESPYKSDWVNLDHVEATGKYTGRIVMKQPTAYLWTIGLCDGSGAIVSRAAMAALGDKAARQPVGSGPYRVASIDPKTSVVLQPNPGYGGARPAWTEITARIVPDPKTAELAFRSGEVDFTELTPSTVGGMRGVAGTNIVQKPGLRFIWMSLNVEKKPLDDVRVRQAIYKGLDIEQILLAGYNGLAPRANALIQPAVLGYWKDAPVVKRDVEGAKKLLAEAGVPNPTLKLTLLGQPTFQTMALVVQAQLKQIGVDVQLDVRDGSTYWSSGKGDAGRDLDMVFMRFNGKLDPNFNTQWFTSSQVGVWNWSRWRSPEFDRMNAEAGTTLDEAKRAELVVGCQKLMAESGAFVWLTYDVDIFAAKSWLHPAVMPTGSDWQLAQFTA